MTMTRLHLNIATADYDHVRDIALGRVTAEGITLNYQIYPIEETFFRFTQYREWDVSEMSFAKFVSIMSGDAPDIIGLPVFTSRMFRLASIYVNANGSVKTGADLAGKRIGIPEWAQTAAIYTRGWMTDELGIGLGDVTWVQAGLNEPGRHEQVKLKLPDGITLIAEPERSLRDMLRDGAVDAVFSARPPAGVHGAYAMIVPMFPDARTVETDYFRKTGVFPIMHTIALRRAVYEANPWIAQNLYKAFHAARTASLARIFDRQASRLFVPWIADYAEETRKVLGKDFFPYGIEENRRTLEVYLKWCVEQGIARRPLKPEDLFAPETRTAFRV
jgi:4,5-dihydroxyphthalate decarboxylase